MKKIRIWLLVFLAVLLPLRGALAAGMLCEMGPMNPAVSVSHDGAAMAPAGHGHDHAGQALSSAAHAANESGNAPDTDADSDACNLCVAYCAVTAMPVNVSALASPPDLAAASYPSFSAFAPSFISGGLERPPKRL